MTTPTYCTSCGHELGIGRFCTNCGKPVRGRHPEATHAPSARPPAPPAVPAAAPMAAPVTTPAPARAMPSVPPSVGEVPPAARYPLFADAGPTGLPPAGPPPVGPPTGPPPAGPPTAETPVVRRTGTPGWVLWVAALVFLALVAGLGGFLLLGSDGDGDRASEDPSQEQRSDSPGDPTTGASPAPDSSGTGAAVEPPEPDDVVDLTDDVEVQVPSVAPGSRDRENKPVDYQGTNLLDGKSRTCWRMVGDGTGETITFDLGGEVVITEVGLINGYAKVDGRDNWYAGNRRVRAVQWEFDDGTRITQELADRQSVQMAEIGPVLTSTIRMHLVMVTPPGKGRNGRDFTAISEVRFLGAPAA